MMGLLECNPIISQGIYIYMYSYCVEISEASVNKIVGNMKTKSYSHSYSTYPNPNLPSNR